MHTWSWPSVVGLALCVAGTSGPASAHAQTLSGLLLEAYAERPIAGGEVHLLSVEGDTLVTALTDGDGRFTLRAPEPGSYVLAAGAGSRHARVEGPVELLAGETLRLEVRLAPDSVVLEPIIVDAEARVPRLDRVGFYDRARAGVGTFVTREGIERRNPVRVADLLRPLPGVSVFGGSVVFNRSRGARALLGQGPCPAKIWVDGIPLLRSMGSMNDLDPLDVEAMEVYAGPSQVPVQYGGANAACGVILIWLR